MKRDRFAKTEQGCDLMQQKMELLQDIKTSINQLETGAGIENDDAKSALLKRIAGLRTLVGDSTMMSMAIVSLKDYETETDELAFPRGVVQGLIDLEEGREKSLADVQKRLGLS